MTGDPVLTLEPLGGRKTCLSQTAAAWTNDWSHAVGLTARIMALCMLGADSLAQLRKEVYQV